MFNTTDSEYRYSCKNHSMVAECDKLLNSKASLLAYNHHRQIRLMITTQLLVPLDLTLHSSSLCNISCEGGAVAPCPTNTSLFTWENTGEPFYFKNCTTAHYCVSATMGGECCPVYTKTVFMESHSNEIFSTDSLQWSLILVTLGIILMFVGFGAVLVKRLNTGPTRAQKDRSENSVVVPLAPNISKVTTVVCFYLKEEKPSFLKDINSLKSFLGERGLNVVDIFDEEEAIHRSLQNWVFNIMNSESTKLVMIDTEILASLWTRDSASVMRPVEQAILYVRQCVHANNEYCKLFVVSFQDRTSFEKGPSYLENGSRYIFPTNGEILARDIIAST